MQHRVKQYQRLAAMTIVALATVFGSASIMGTPAMATARPPAPEKNPPGDIPDTQVFVTFVSPLGFSLNVPEGWARTERGDGASFSDKYNAVSVTVASASAPPTADHEAASLVKAGRAVKIAETKKIMLRSGQALLIVYTSNSETNPVTNKQLRLESNRYLIYRGGKLAALDLSAPLGADNADQWKLISNSFRWR